MDNKIAGLGTRHDRFRQYSTGLGPTWDRLAALILKLSKGDVTLIGGCPRLNRLLWSGGSTERPWCIEVGRGKEGDRTRKAELG